MNESAFNDPRLTKDGEGYVYWKGRHVEHYSFERSDEGREREEQAARDLIRCCEFLESIGVVPTARTAIWFWSWFEALTLDHKKRERGLSLFRRQGNFASCGVEELQFCNTPQ